MAIVCSFMQILKNIVNNEKFDRFIPLIAVVSGSLIGLAAFFIYPALMPTDNVVTAILIGASSGWAATGANQTVKQLKNKNDK